MEQSCSERATIHQNPHTKNIVLLHRGAKLQLLSTYVSRLFLALVLRLLLMQPLAGKINLIARPTDKALPQCTNVQLQYITLLACFDNNSRC